MARHVNVSAVGLRPLVDKPETNQEALEKMIDHWRTALEWIWPHEPDLLVLPEACDRFPAFSPERKMEYFRHRGDQIRDHFADEARKHHANIAYSAARELRDGTWRNRTEIIDREGNTVGVYDKNHLTRGEYENSGLLFGVDAPLIQCDFGTVACAICFDLNFEELRKRYKPQRPDLIAFSSMYHGGFVQRTWAYDCQAYFVGAVAGIQCDVLSPQGESLASSSCYHPFVNARINLDRELIHLDYNGEKLLNAQKKYKSKIEAYCPNGLGSVLLTSETDEFTVKDVIKEFDMITWRDYYADSLKHREEHLHESEERPR